MFRNFLIKFSFLMVGLLLVSCASQKSVTPFNAADFNPELNSGQPTRKIDNFIAEKPTAAPPSQRLSDHFDGLRYLIASVEALEGATFIRNGNKYDARSASNHLRLKLKSAGDRVTTAEGFIRYCGSKSSMTGVPYLIKLADGTTVKAEAFFRKKLMTFTQDRP